MRWFLSIAIVLGFAVAAPARVLAAPPPYYPSVDWIPAARGNYDVGRTQAITTIVIHETGGSYTSAIHWFQNPASLTSAHYLVKAWDGGIIQFVAGSTFANPYRLYRSWAELVASRVRGTPSASSSAIASERWPSFSSRSIR